jgi:hypothetical protein
MTHDNWEKEYERWHAKRRLERKIKSGNFALPFEENIHRYLPAKPLPSSYTNQQTKMPWLIIAAIALIPLVIVFYLVYQHVIIPQDFEYKYQIGSSDDKYLTPRERISQAGALSLEGDELGYRNLTSGLVYFDVPIARFAHQVTITTRFRNDFPAGATLSIGAKDQPDWHYKWQKIFTNDGSAAQGEWLITKTTFNLSDTYLTNNHLSLVFNTPHLSKQNFSNYTIPVDWIDIVVHKRGLFE